MTNRVYIVMQRRGAHDVPVKTFDTRRAADHYASNLTAEKLREEHMREAVGLLVEKYRNKSDQTTIIITQDAYKSYERSLCDAFMIDYDAYAARKNDLPEGNYTVADTAFETL